jgi:hypothetical protein
MTLVALTFLKPMKKAFVEFGKYKDRLLYSSGIACEIM